MKFDVKEARECLVKNREVYTVRAFESNNEISHVQVVDIGLCTKEKICKVSSYKDLTRYTHLSGFKSPMDWWHMIEKLGATGGFMYHVVVSPEEEFFFEICKKIDCKFITRCKLRESGAIDLCPHGNELREAKDALSSPSSIITFTGNRNISAGTVQEALQAVHEKYPNTTWRTGMAYGLDMAVAEFAAANGIPFEAHLPFPAYIQTKRWNPANQARHLELLEKAVKVFTYSQEFSMAGYQLRNVKMADGTDIVVAFNRNKHGGTVNMVSHCIDSGIPVIDGYSLSFLSGAAQS